MPRIGSTQFALPEFSGATKRIVLWNLVAFAILWISHAVKPDIFDWLFHHLALRPDLILREPWQPLTYSLIHPTLLGTLFELLSLWFLCGFLQTMHGGRWMTGLYFASVLGAAALAVVIFSVGLAFGNPPPMIAVYGCLGGVLGMITAIGLLHGETQFQLMFVIGIKAKYMAIIYILIAVAMTFTEQSVYAFAQLGGAAGAYLYIKLAPKRGFGFVASEGWYGFRNKYYRWKRRRAASKFQVYMKKQGRTVRFDGQGRLIDEDDVKHDDRKRWN